jgi:hypothetical protein
MAKRISSLGESKCTLQNASVSAICLQRDYDGGGTTAEGTTVNDGLVFIH